MGLPASGSRARPPRPWRWLAAATAAVLLAALAPAAQGQVERSGGNLVILINHPYPDPVDPLGFPFTGFGSNGTGYYQQRYASFDRENDGFSYPHLTVDGTFPIEGVPDAGRPYQSTLEAYQAAVAKRLREAPAATITVRTQAVDGRVLVAAEVTPAGPMPGESLEAWMALVEDNVQYRAPPAVSNGVNNHRFTVRSIQGQGRLDFDQGMTAELSASFTTQPEWRAEQLHVAIWIQQGAAYGTRFDANEVAQATLHPVAGDVVTRQTGKAVLLEALSATWCQSCVYGDRALETMAEENGYAAAVSSAGKGYWEPPTSWGVAAAALAGAVALAAPNLRRRREP